LDGEISGLLGLELDKSVTLGFATLIIVSNLAADNASELEESVIQVFSGNALVEVLDKDVALSRFSERGISLRPHDSARSTLDGRVVKSFKSLFSISLGDIIDVSVTQRSSSNGIFAHSNHANSSKFVEDFEQISFFHITFQKLVSTKHFLPSEVSNVKRDRREGRGSRGSSRGGSGRGGSGGRGSSGRGGSRNSGSRGSGGGLRHVFKNLLSFFLFFCGFDL
jgi:uncharacterized membrane protein YgcG